MYQLSSLSRQRNPVDQPKILNLRELGFEKAAERARESRSFTSQLARDTSYLNNLIPAFEIHALAIDTRPEDNENCMELSIPNPADPIEYDQGLDVEEMAEDLLLRCPSKICMGRLTHGEKGGKHWYLCSENRCGVRVEETGRYWDLFELCERLNEVYGMHEYCGRTPGTYLGREGDAEFIIVGCSGCSFQMVLR